VKKGSKLTEPINTFDTAATMAYIFGYKTPECWTGKPVTAAFEGKKQGTSANNDK
jgi:hypothetical protein